MLADSTTETGLNIILRPSLPGLLSGSASTPPARRPRARLTSARVTELLESAILIVAGMVVAVGLGLMTYGVTTAIVDGPGHAFPNVQHASTQPTPRK